MLSKEVRTIFKYKKSGLKLKKKNFRLTIVILWSFFRKKNQQLITYNFRLYNRIGISLMILRQKDIRLSLIPRTQAEELKAAYPSIQEHFPSRQLAYGFPEHWSVVVHD